MERIAVTEAGHRVQSGDVSNNILNGKIAPE